MNALPALIDRHRNLLSRATVAWTTCGVILYVLAPRFTPVLLVLGAVAPIAWHLISKGLPRLRPSAVTMVLALAGAYLTANASWSLSPSAAHSALYLFFMSVVALHFTVGALRGCDADALRAIAIGLYAGMAIAGAVICFETFSLQWFRRLLMSAVPSLRPGSRHMIVQGDWVTFLESYLLNRSITALTFLFWPSMLVIALLTRVPRLQGWMLAGVVPVVAAILGSKHATSKIAFIGAAITFLGYELSAARTRRAVTWGWTAIMLLVVPLAFLAYQSELYLSTWLPHSAQHRVVIWGYTSQQIAKAPILGAGIATTQALDKSQRDDAPFAPGSDFRLTTGWYTHNVYLQTWYETGAVGAVILLSIGLFMLKSLARAPALAQPYLYATFVTCALMSASSFSMWQAWFMASFAFIAAFAMVGWALAIRVAVINRHGDV